MIFFGRGFFRKIVCVLVLALSARLLWAANPAAYYWVGGGNDHDWNNVLNWSYSSGAPAGNDGSTGTITDAPGTGAATTQPVYFDNSLYANGPTLPLAFPSSLTALTISSGSVISSTPFSVGTLALSAGCSLDMGGNNLAFIFGGTGTIDGSLINAGTLDISGASVTSSADLSVATLTMNGASSLNMTNQNLTITASGTIAGSLINAGTLDISGANPVTSNIDFSVATLTMNGTSSLNMNSNDLTVTTAGTIAGTLTNASTLIVTGTTTIGANITTSGDQTYGGAVTLNDDVACTSTGGNILFSNTVNGNHDLVVTANTGDVHFNAAVGGSTPLAELTVASTTAIGGNITTAGDQTYGGAVTLIGNVSLNVTSGDILFSSTVNGANELTINADSVAFNAAVGGSTPLAKLTVTGTATIGGNISTTGIQTYNDAITLSAAATLTTTNNAVTFASTINGANNLVIAAGTGAVAFNANVGSSLALVSLNVTGTGATTLGANITTTGIQTYGGAVVLADDATFTSTGSAIVFNHTVNGAHALVVDASTGGVQFNAEVGDTAPEPTTLTVTGTTTIRADILTTGNQTYNSAVTLSSTATLSVTSGNIQFLGTVDGNYTLTAYTIAGAVTFSNAVGSTFPFESLDLTGSPVSFNGTVTGNNLGPLTVNAGAGGAVNFGDGAGADTVSGWTSLDITGTTTVANGATVNIEGGSSVTGNITIASGGAVNVGADATVSGNVTINGSLNFTAASTLEVGGNWTKAAAATFTAGTGTVEFSGAAATIEGANTFNNVEFTGAGTATITDANTFNDFTCTVVGKTIKFPPALTTASYDSDNVPTNATTKTTISRMFTVTDATLTTSSSSPASMPSSYTNNWADTWWFLHITGTVDVENTNFEYCVSVTDIAADVSPATKNNTGNAQTIRVFADYVWLGSADDDWDNTDNWKNKAAPTYTNATTILIDTDTSGTPNHPDVQADLSPIKSLTVNAGKEFDLKGFNIAAGSGTNAGIINFGTIKLTGTSAQTITGDVSHGTGSVVKFYGTAVATEKLKDTIVSHLYDYANLTIEKSSNVFTAGTAIVVANETKIQGAGTVTFGDALTTAALSNSATSSVDITFNAHVAVSGTSAASAFATTGSLTLGSAATDPLSFAGGILRTGSGTTTINGNVTSGSAGAGAGALFQSTGAVTFGSGAYFSELYGEISFAGAVTLTSGDVSIAANRASPPVGSGQITFSGAVSGDGDLTITATNGVTFNGTVGSGTALASLTVEAPRKPIVIHPATIITAGFQSYNGNVELHQTATFETTNSFITFNGKIDSDTTPRAIIITTGTGDITFDQGTIAGGMQPLASFTVSTGSGNVLINSAEIYTTGDQSYNKAVIFMGTPLLDSSAGVISFTEVVELDTTFADVDATIQLSGTPSSARSISFKQNIIYSASNDKNLIVNAGSIGAVNFGDGTGTDNVSGLTSLTVTGTTTVANGAAIDSTSAGIAQTYTGNVTVANGGQINIAGTSNVTGNITIDGDLNFPTAAVTLAANNITIGATGTLVFTAAATLEVGGNWTKDAAATFTAGTGTVEFTGAGTATITGANTFNNFTCGAGKTIEFPPAGTANYSPDFVPTDATTKTTIDGTFTITGATLTASGTPALMPASYTNGWANTWWFLHITGTAAVASTSFEYCVSVTDLAATVGSTGANDQIYDTPSPPGTGYGQTVRVFADYVWLGLTDTAWTTGTNWKNGAVPQYTAATKIIIDTQGTNHPVLSQNIYPAIKSITINTGKQLDIAGYDVAAAPGNVADTDTGIINKGIIRLTGANTISGRVSHETESVVEFYGTANFPTTGNIGDHYTDITVPPYDFYNLRVSGSGTFTFSGSTLNVSNIAVLDSSGTLTFGAGANITAQAVMVGGNVNFATGGTSSKITGDVYIYAASAFSGGGTFTIDGDLHIAGNLTLSAPLAVTGSGVLYDGMLTLGADIGVAKDLVLLNGNPTSMYTDPDTGITDLFKYDHAERTAANNLAPINLTGGLKAAFPPTTAFAGFTPPTFPAVYNGAVAGSSLNSRTITVQKNFYNNGVNTGGAAWDLNIPANDDATAAFAEAYNMQVQNCTVSGGVVAAAENSAANITASTGNTGWAFSRGELLADSYDYATDGTATKQTDLGNTTAGSLDYGSGTYTVFDDVVRVEFHDGSGNPVKIENTRNEISSFASQIAYDTGTSVFAGAFIDADCTVSTDNKGDLAVFFLRTAGITSNPKWNTDATGRSAGDPQSTDRRGENHGNGITGVMPRLYIEKATTSLFNLLRDENKNRVTTGYVANTLQSFEDVTDRAAPVLVAVYTGQEPHTPNLSGSPTSQLEHDGHNFIEFRYSEAIEIAGVAASALQINIQTSNSFAAGSLGGEISGAGFRKAAAGPPVLDLQNPLPQGEISFYGYGSIDSGKLNVGESSSPGGNGSVHSVYRYFQTVNENNITPSPIGSLDVQTHRVRVGIASFVNGVVNSSAHNWVGYILADNAMGTKNTETPSGVFTRDTVHASEFSDNTKKANGSSAGGYRTILDNSTTTGNHALPALSVRSTPLDVDGPFGLGHDLIRPWDTYPPKLALSTEYDVQSSKIRTVYELDPQTGSHIPNSNLEVFTEENGISADRIEFHFLDNGNTLERDPSLSVPKYDVLKIADLTAPPNENMYWLSKFGWQQYGIPPGSSPETDTQGGSRRPGGTGISTGGIRYSSWFGSKDSFLYKITPENGHLPVQGLPAAIAHGTTGGSLNQVSSGNTDLDNLFFKITFASHHLGIYNTSDNKFSFKYNADLSQYSYITDLAGNLFIMNDDIRSRDRTPPRIALSISPRDSSELFVMFNKKISLYPGEGSVDNYGLSLSHAQIMAKIAKQFELKIAINKYNSSYNTLNINIDPAVPARLVARTDVGTVLAFKLTRAVTLDDILNVYIAVIDTPAVDPPNSGTDWLGLPTPAFFDIQGNAARPGPAHTLSDFAAGFVSTLYAFDNKDALLGEGQFLPGEWIVRDFSGGGNNAGRLFANKDIFIAARVDEPLIEDLRMIISIAPPADSVSTYFNARTGRKSRLWLPWTYDNNSPIAEAGNLVNGTTTRDLFSVSRAAPSSSINFLLYNDPDSPPSNPALLFNWKSPAQVQFLYELFSAAPGAAGWNIPGYTPAVTDANNIGGGNQYYIDHDADENIPPNVPNGIPTPRVPLYGIRLADPADLLSIDLWSFDLVDILRQRGGVTILNNVINSLVREKTHIEVDLPSAGNLTVMVLTLDGNIVKYLKRGREEMGLHYYSWDGTNNNGTPVARGMYFVRVVGPEINEVRKVMVVKE